MKKISFIAIVGLLVLSCTKSTVDLEIHPSPVDKEETVEVGRTANIVLYASVDKEVETKLSATEEDGHVEFKFEENDELSTFFVAGDKKDVNVKFTFNADGKFVPDEGQLYTTLDDNMPAVYGIYPYEKGMSSVTDLEKVPVSIPQVQMYDPSTYKENGNLRYPKNYSRFVAKPTTLIKEDDGSYYIDTDFFTMGSMIKLQVQNSTGEPLSIRSVNIYGASGLAGDFSADLTADPSFSNDNDSYKLTPVDGGNQYNHVCVSFGNDGFTLPDKTRMPVYAFVNAVDFDDAGFSMTVSTDKSTYQADFTERKEGVDGFARNARYTYTVDLNSERLIGSDYVARYLDSNNEWQYKETLSDAISDVPANGIVELVKDAAHGTSTAIILTGKTFTLNGNGHTYDVSGRTNNVFSHSAATSAADVTFRNIKFKSTETAESPNGKRLIYNSQTNSTITLAEGTEIEGIFYCGTNGGIVYNTGTINIDGAKINNCGVKKNADSGGNGGFIYSTGSGATVNINRGEISNCSSEGSGGAIYSSSGILNMNGGYISNCSASSGSAIFTTGKVNMVGGEIRSYSGTTGAIYGNSYTTEITIGRENDPSSCPVINNTTGRGIYSYGITKVYGGKITTFGVSVYSLSGKNGNAELNIYDGSLESTNNNVVYVKKSDNYTTNAEISGGKFKYSGASNLAVVYSDDANLTVDGGYFSKEVKSDYLKKVDETAGTRAYKNYPNDDFEGYPYKVEEQHAAIFACGSVREQKATISDALNAANEATDACSVILCENVEMASKIDVTNAAGVTFDLNGNTLTQKSTSRLGVAGSGYLKIIDSRGDGKITQSATGSNTFSISSGTLEIAGGSIEQAASATKGNVVVSETANLNVSGGSIITTGSAGVSFSSSGQLNVSNDCSISGKGYALSIASGCVTISGGQIESSTTYAVYMQNGTLTISGDSKILSTAGADVKSPALCISSNFTEEGSVDIKGGQIISEYYAPVVVYAKAGSISITGPAYLYGGDTANGYIVRKGTGAIDITGVTDGFFGGAYASFAKDYVNVKCASGFHVGNIKTPVTKGDKKYACKIYADQ